MSELDWHKITSAEEVGAGYDIYLDITPEFLPDEAAEYDGTLVRTGRPGWVWWARKVGKDPWNEAGGADTKDEAILDGLAAVRRRTRTESV